LNTDLDDDGTQIEFFNLLRNLIVLFPLKFGNGTSTGYMTTTQIKFLLTVEDDSTVGDQRTVDETIKRLFVKLHRLYVEYTLNPFSPLTGAISSKKFDQKVKDCVTAYNRTLH
jgi:hypothetical protein